MAPTERFELHSIPVIVVATPAKRAMARTGQRPRQPWWIVAGVLLGVALLSAVGHWWMAPSAAVRSAKLLDEARRLSKASQPAKAEQAAAKAWKLWPHDFSAVLLAAESAAATGAYSRAVGYLNVLSSAAPPQAFRGALLSARWNAEGLHRLSAAEAAYRTALAIAPDDPEVCAGLANLLALCGRKREATPYVLRLLRQGVDTELLLLIAREDGVIDNPDALDKARTADPTDPNAILGIAWRLGDSGQAEDAIPLLEEAVRLSPQHVPSRVALGSQLLAAERYDATMAWARDLPEDADAFPESWLVRGSLAEHFGHPAEALRCYAEAVRLAPESKRAVSRLAASLGEAEPELAAAIQRHLAAQQALVEAQNRVLMRGPPKTIDPLMELAQRYDACGRRWEALGWCRLAASIAPVDPEAQRQLAQWERTVADLPLLLTDPRANPLTGFDLTRFPRPTFSSPTAPAENTVRAILSLVSFRDDAAAAGLNFRYVNGSTTGRSQRMFAFTGGGLAILDYDLDGDSDAFLTQGQLWPPVDPDLTLNDRLFRNLRGTRFDDVTIAAGLQESGFGQGAAVGDVDSDGFPDVYVANIGGNALWRNNGDGTFHQNSTQAGLTDAAWTTSCLMADLSGDGLPDLYDVNYVQGVDVFDRICRHPDGSPKICMPFDFDDAPDRLWLNDGAGGFRDATTERLGVIPPGKGLGIAAWDADGSGRLSVLVANDTTPNFFFVPALTAAGDLRLEERAFAYGMALNGDGKATGCMGLALGDLNRDGRLDIHITNFYHESNTLYLSTKASTFEDQSRAVGLDRPTMDMLGFGTQFLDADHDGRLELFVANGHIDDWRAQHRPYRMRPQLFRWDGRHFLEDRAAGLGDYFQSERLGRAVVRWDWNRDGVDDLLVGHLDEPVALLTNTTAVRGKSISLRLFGVTSNRDAVGTTVRSRVGDEWTAQQLTAGDGYQSSNERRLNVNVGTQSFLSELEVRWPSGLIQRFANVAADREYLLVEGRLLLPAADRLN